MQSKKASIIIIKWKISLGGMQLTRRLCEILSFFLRTINSMDVRLLVLVAKSVEQKSVSVQAKLASKQANKFQQGNGIDLHRPVSRAEWFGHQPFRRTLDANAYSFICSFAHTPYEHIKVDRFLFEKKKIKIKSQTVSMPLSISWRWFMLSFYASQLFANISMPKKAALHRNVLAWVFALFLSFLCVSPAHSQMHVFCIQSAS